jgi:hypothetical protein
MSPRTRSIVAASIALAVFVTLIAWFARRDRAVEQAPTIVPHVEASSLPTTQPELTRDPTESAREPTPPLPGEILERTKSAAATPAASEPVLCTVLGFVWPPSGGALDVNVRVYFVDHLGRREFSTASPDGEFSITGLAPGTWWVSCHARCGLAQTRIELDAREPERRLDLRLVPPREVRVRVTSTTGEPICVATLAAATLEHPGEWIDDAGDNSVQPLGVGHFQPSDSYAIPQSGGYIGSVELDVEPPVFVSLVRYQRVLATQRIERSGQDAEFVIDPRSPLLDKCSVRGRVVDATTRQPVAGAVVLVGGRIRATSPDAPGEFTFQGLWPGHYDVVVMPKHGSVVKHTGVLLEPGATLDLGDVELAPESWIDALVVDQQGHPVSTRFRIEPFDGRTGPNWRASVNDETASKDDGSLHIGGLIAGKYLLTLATGESSLWGRMVKLVDLSNGPVEGLRIELTPGVTLVVRAANENSLGVRWTMCNSNGLRVMSTRFSSLAPMALSFAPGTYTVEVETPNGAAPIVREVVLEKDPVELALP